MLSLILILFTYSLQSQEFNLEDALNCGISIGLYPSDDLSNLVPKYDSGITLINKQGVFSLTENELVKTCGHSQSLILNFNYIKAPYSFVLLNKKTEGTLLSFLYKTQESSKVCNISVKPKRNAIEQYFSDVKIIESLSKKEKLINQILEESSIVDLTPNVLEKTEGHIETLKVINSKLQRCLIFPSLKINAQVLRVLSINSKAFKKLNKKKKAAAAIQGKKKGYTFLNFIEKIRSLFIKEQ